MSMTREEAAKWLEETIQDTDTYFSSCSEALQKELDEQKEVFLLALSALRPVSRERVEKVWPGCPYCKEDGEGYVQKFGAYSIQNGELTTGHCKPQKIKFCPHCSRPLTDEAVDMVMEKINNMEEMTNEH